MLTSIVFQNVSWLCSRRGRIAFFCCLLLFACVFLLSLLELVGFVQSIQCSTVRTCVYCIYSTLSTRLTCSFLLMVSPRVTEHLVLLFGEFTTECTPQTPFQCDSLSAHQQVCYWFWRLFLEACLSGQPSLLLQPEFVLRVAEQLGVVRCHFSVWIRFPGPLVCSELEQEFTGYSDLCSYSAVCWPEV